MSDPPPSEPPSGSEARCLSSSLRISSSLPGSDCVSRSIAPPSSSQPAVCFPFAAAAAAAALTAGVAVACGVAGGEGGGRGGKRSGICSTTAVMSSRYSSPSSTVHARAASWTSCMAESEACSCSSRRVTTRSVSRNSHTPSDARTSHLCDGRSAHELVTGVAHTPMRVKMSSPIERDMARPHPPVGEDQTRPGPNLDAAVTVAPAARSRAISSAESGFWSSVRATARTPDAPRSEAWPMTARESPALAVWMRPARTRATTAVVPDL
mmetsp:Transcript_44461/g.144514  ORF Transcript_44461/g.144514 Transcript_44461/m.144514 type:complete len:267 (+) Transcript_44461:651-1451(+)